MAEAAADTGRRRAAGTAKYRSIPTWLAIFGLGLSLYLLTLPADLRNNADTVDRFFVTQSLLHHKLNVGGCGVANAPHDVRRLVPGRDGCYYAIYGPGQTVLMSPLYVAGKLFADLTKPRVVAGTSGAMAAAQAANDAHEALVTAIFTRILDPILGSLVLVLFYLVALEVGYRRRTAILLTLVLGLASTVFPDVQSGQEQIETTLAILALVYSMLRVRRAVVGQSRTRWLVACGAAAGFGIFTRYDFAVDLVVFLVVGAAWAAGLLPPSTRADRARSGTVSKRIELPNPRAGWPLLVGFLPFLLADGLWNTLRFGEPWKVGQSLSNQFGTPVWNGFVSLLASPGKGLIWYLPLLWLVPFAWKRYARRAPEMGLLTIALLVVSLLFYGIVKYWNGDPGWGPRYLFPLVPLLILPIGELFERFATFRPTRKMAIVAVVGLSLSLQLAAVSVDPWRYWYHLIEHRQTAGQPFYWDPNTYRYYWSSDPSLSPVIYQFAAAVDVARIAGDKNMGIPEASQAVQTLCNSIASPRGRVHTFDQCKLAGVSLRPLNTISPIWLSDRYQFVNAGPVPLALGWRIAIVGMLGLFAALSAAVLHVQFWAKDETRQ